MKNNRSYILAEIAAITESTLEGNPQHVITDIADLETASSSDASFLSNHRYFQAFRKSSAGVVFIDQGTERLEGRNYLISEKPSEAFQKIIDLFYPQRQHPSGFKGIHPSAVIHPTATIETDTTISPYVVIDEHVKIGKKTFIGSHVYIGPNVIIGSECTIYSGVIIREECVIGDRVVLQPGVVIGSCGFGYTTNSQGRHIKLNQVGNVRIENDVEIGANTTVDRSRFKSTEIHQGSKIDNLVQIAHGVSVGRYNMIAAQTGIAGSTTTGSYVVLAGQVAVAGHLFLEDHVTVAGKSGVSKSLKKGIYNGIPAQPLEIYNRNQIFLRNIKKIVERIELIEKKILPDT